MSNDKQVKFEKLAEARVAKAIGAIKLIGNLAGPNYKYTDGHVGQIVEALGAEVEALRRCFAKKEKAKPVFSFNNKSD